MLIRKEKERDYKKVYMLVKEAFESADQSDDNEQDLVAALRQGTAFVPELSLVAEIGGRIVGYILFTKVRIGNHTELALAPLAILPRYQNQGIGMALIKKGHKIAKELGYHYSIVLGSETYYPKSGYVPAENYGIASPFDVPSKNFMAYRLAEPKEPIEGMVEYAPEFGIGE